MKRGDERFKTAKTERDSIKGKGNDTRIKLLNCGMYIMYINVYKQSLNLFKPSVILYNIHSWMGIDIITWSNLVCKITVEAD